MNKFIFYAFVTLTFSQHSVASVSASQSWLRENKLAMRILKFNDATEIVATQPTARKTSRTLQFFVVGSVINVYSEGTPGADMIEVSRPTPNTISLIRRDYYNRDKNKRGLAQVYATKRPDGQFFVRFIDDWGNGFEGVVTYSYEDDRHLNPTCC